MTDTLENFTLPSSYKYTIQDAHGDYEISVGFEGLEFHENWVGFYLTTEGQDQDSKAKLYWKINVIRSNGGYGFAFRGLRLGGFAEIEGAVGALKNAINRRLSEIDLVNGFTEDEAVNLRKTHTLTRINDVGNFYANGILVAKSNATPHKFYYLIENYSTDVDDINEWKPIDEELYNAFMKHKDTLLGKSKKTS